MVLPAWLKFESHACDEATIHKISKTFQGPNWLFSQYFRITGDAQQSNQDFPRSETV
jgi:hypothetical protein